LLQAKDTQAAGYDLIKGASSNYPKAIAEFERSRDLFAELGDTCEAAVAEGWAAQFLIDIGKLADAQKRLTVLIETSQQKNFKLLLPMGHYWLAIADFSQNRFSESSRNLKLALREAEAANNIFEVDHAAECLAAYYSLLGEFEPATSFASRMLSLKRLYRESSGQSIRDLGTLALLSRNLNFVSTSFNVANEKLHLVRNSSPTSRTLNEALRDVVYAAAAHADFPAALQYANESLSVAQADGIKPENMNTIAQVYVMLADVKSQMKDYGGALGDYDEALTAYQQLPEVTTGLYQIHKGKLLCFQKLDQPANFAAELKTVLALAEQYRATIREDSSRQAFFAGEQLVFDMAADNALKAGDSAAAFEYVEASRARSLLEFVESKKSITELEKEFAAVARPLSLTDIQQRLPEQVELVQYAMLPERLAIWVVSKSQLRLIEKPISAAELEKKIAAYQASITAKTAAEGVQPAARELYDLLIPAGLATNQQLCLVPDKALHQLAFASLVSPDKRFLVEDFALSYAPSASVLVLASENANRKEQFKDESILSVGNPDYERDDAPNLPDLASAEVEARSIAEDYHKAVLMVGSEATKTQFLRTFSAMEVIHFAGHFVANAQSPANSKLLFSGGTLRSSELSNYKSLRAKLVVLSACDTGFERYNQSEGAIGIARTFLALGAPLVVASEWKVDTERTKDLMIAFHRNRTKNGMSTSQSLRQAQLELLGKAETRAPFYWAAFSLFGGYANY
jgi:CHAT domain-containing protein/tetratricopeptide (TPR) repeat protein